jgi:fibronectin-binding autotransporter adhesin
LASLGVILLAPCVARAAPVSWKNPVDGNWSDGTKWSTGTAPGQTDDAIITMPGAYMVTVDVDAKVASLTLGAASGTQTQTLSVPSNTLTVTGASAVGSLAVLDLAGGTLVADVLTVTGALNWTAGTMSGGATTTIAPGATLTISGGAFVKSLKGRMSLLSDSVRP